MAGFGINELKSQLTGGGARQALFQVNITNPVFSAADFKVPFMVKAAQIPNSTVGRIEVPWMGRKIYMGGDRVFDEWRCTVINDEDFAVRNALERWMDAINSHDSNTRAMPNQYKSTGQVLQYSKTGVVIREYTLEGLFPIAVDAIDLDWGSNDTIEDFAVTFSIDLWTNENSITGSSTT